MLPFFSSVYNKLAKLHIPTTSLIEEFKVALASLVMTLRDSKDPKIKTRIKGSIGRK